MASVSTAIGPSANVTLRGQVFLVKMELAILTPETKRLRRL